MTLNNILDSIYIIPVLLDHFEKPTENTRSILNKHGITDDIIQETHNIRHLLKYHLEMIRNNYYTNYPLLRQGLKEYFQEHLSGIWHRLGFVDKEWLMFDYGCGQGYYSEAFMEANPRSEVICVDKDITTNVADGMLRVDFEVDKEWYRGHIGTADLVLLSEVLHCKTLRWQDYLVDSSYQLLKPGGLLVINENDDACMEYRITKLKHQEMPLVNFARVKLLTENKFELINFDNINQHFIYVYKKI